MKGRLKGKRFSYDSKTRSKTRDEKVSDLHEMKWEGPAMRWCHAMSEGERERESACVWVWVCEREIVEKEEGGEEKSM